MSSLPFKTQMSPVALPLHSKLKPEEVTLKALDMPVDVWQRASLSEKMNAVQKVAGNFPNATGLQTGTASDGGIFTLIGIIERLDRENPKLPTVQYHERVVYIPQEPGAKARVARPARRAIVPAGEPSPQITAINMAVWLTFGALAGGMLYFVTRHAR